MIILIKKHMRLISLVLLVIALTGVSYARVMHPSIITFVCTGNTGRSPMAEYLAKNSPLVSTDGYQVDSRGVRVNPSMTTLEENAVTAMQEIGLAMTSHHRAKQLTASDVDNAKLVLTMTKAQKEKILSAIAPAAKNVYMLSECADGTETDVPDAYGKDLPFYRDTRDSIKKYIEEMSARNGNCLFPQA